MRASLDAIFQESAELKLRFLEGHRGLVEKAVLVLVEAFQKGNKVLLFGNGGSAADAQHIAAEFVNRFAFERPALPAIALTTDTSVLTSIANDRDYSQIFARQVEALGKVGDVAIGISTSGRSPSVLKGIQAARRLQLRTLGLTGAGGKKLASLVEFPFVVPSRSTPRIQEVHITLAHAICELVDEKLFGSKGGGTGKGR